MATAKKTLPAAKKPGRQRLVGKLAVETAAGAFLGDTRIRLLEEITARGSITAAAKAVPLSYKAAWDAVDAMNNLSERALVERSVGGKSGGGTRITAYGRRVVALYRAMEEQYQGNLDRLGRMLGDDGGAEDVPGFRGLLRRLSMRSSARNQFAGRVSALREGAVNAEVSLRLDARTELTAMITRVSVEHLRLAMGSEVLALVKAQTVILLTDPKARTSARNHLWGEVARIDLGGVDGKGGADEVNGGGGVNAEVTLALPGGRTVTAIITRESVKALALKPGARACAVIKASDVVLAAFF